jgi:hypothetical protein
MKRIKLAAAIFMLMVLNISAQNLTCTRLYSVCKTNSSPATYEAGVADCVGGTPNRSVWRISIPTNIKAYHITNALISYSTGRNDDEHSFEIKLLDNYGSPSSYQEKWNATENFSETLLFASPKTSSPTTSLSSSFVELLNTAIDNSITSLYISVSCANEYSDPWIYFNSISISFDYVLWTQHNINNYPSGGKVVINSTESPSGSVVKQSIGSSVSLEALSSQTIGTDTYVWNSGSTNKSKWTIALGNDSYDSFTQQTSYTTTSAGKNGTCTDYLKMLCNVTLQNNEVNGDPIQTDNNYTAISQNSVTVYPNNNLPTSDGFYKVFNRWSDGSTASSKVVTPTTHTTVTALYRLKPTNAYKNMAYTGSVGDYITVTWNDHPSSGVSQYRIYRKVKDGSVWGAEVLLATVNSGVGTYTDFSYVYTAGYTDDMLQYDVRAVYTGDDNGTPYTTYADPGFVLVYGTPDASKQKTDNVATKNIETAPTEYSLGSYPNPFNPTTVIRYTMPEAGQVSLKVYNILSQEVANLVESNQSAGVHQVNFNASHLPTGIYIARLQAGAKVMTAKLQLVK